MHLLTQSALLQALGWALVNSLWQMGMLWLGWVLLVNLFPQASPRFRHGLAMMLLVLGALGSLLSFLILYYFRQGGLSVWTGAGLAAGSRLIPMLLPYCSSAYLLVLGCLLIRYSHQYLLSRRLTRQGLSKMPASFRVFIASTARQMGIRPAVSGWLSDMVDVPLTMGFWKPVILLPAAMLSNLSTQQVEAIIIHELAHIRRRDYLLNWLVCVIGLLFFFNPFTRMLIRQLEKEREHCCDDEVLQFRYDAHAYVSALLSLARQHRQAKVALAATGEGGEPLLLQRARRILQQKKAVRRPGVRPFILLALTAAITILGLSSPGRQKEPPMLVSRPSVATPPPAELAFVRIVNSGAPVVAGQSAGSLPQKRSSHEEKSKSRAAHATDTRFSDAALMGKTAGREGLDGDQGGSDESGDADGMTGVSLTQPVALSIIVSDNRDNSLGKPAAREKAPVYPDDPPPTANLVFVPNSSFSFQHIDTIRPEDKLTWIEEATERDIRFQVERLQKELEVQLGLLKRQEARAQTLTAPSKKELKKWLNEQIQLQRDYLRKLEEMHTRLRKAAHHLTTVYI